MKKICYGVKCLTVAAIMVSSVPLAAQKIIPSPSPIRLENNRGEKYIEVKSKHELAAAPTEYKHGDPTADEQLSLEFINRARANPTEEGKRLMDTQDAEAQSAYAYFKINKNATKAAFAGYPVQPPLAFNEKLIIAARKHSKDMKDNNFQGHDGSDGSSMSQRLNREGYTGWTRAGENVAAYSKSVWYGHCGLNVDWGEQNQIDLGHRQNIMNFTGGVFTEVGIGIEYRPGANFNQTGPFIITQDFGHRGNYFVTGVVYKDNNSNGFYDVGEGIKGVTLTPSKGDYFAVSSTSGGYAIPINSLSGSLTVTATGGPFTTPTSLQVSVGGNQNVKLDFMPNLPGVIALISPPDMETLDKKTIEFVWGKASKPATNYGFELATDEEFKDIVKKDETLKDVKTTIADLKNNTTYYWRVRAKTTEGWGDYSLPYSFMIVIYAPDVTLVSPADQSEVKEQSVTLKWNKTNPSSERYKVQLCGDRFFFDNIAEDSTVTDTTKSFDKLEWDATLYWRVAAFSDGIWGNYSDAYEFTVTKPSAPQAPELVSPADDMKTSSNEIEFTWKSNSNDATIMTNWLEISNSQNFDSYVFRDSAISTEKSTVKDLEYGKTYYWRTKSKNSVGWGEYSDTRSFMIFALGINEENPTIQTGIKLYPNPSQLHTNVEFELKYGTSVTMELYDADGKVVKSSELGIMAAGKQTLLFDVRELSSGVYTVRIIADGAAVQKQAIVVH